MGLWAVWKKYREVKPRWEQLCHGCGQCCYERTPAKDGRFTPIRPCEFLDEETLRCVVYPHRFEACPYCRKVTLRHALSRRYLPDSCGYVQTFRPLLRSGKRP